MSRFRVSNLNVFSIFSDEDSLKCKIKQVALKCQKDIEHFSFSNEKFHSYIADYLVPYIYYDPLYWYSNPLIREIKKHIGNEIPMCFLNIIEFFENDSNYRNSLNTVKQIIEQILLLGKDISSEEAIELIDASILLNDFYPELVCNYLIGKIMEKKLVLDDANYQRLFFQFVELFKQRNSLSCYFMKGRFERRIVDDKVIVIDAIIKKKNGTYRIIFNEHTLTCDNILSNLRTLFHETWHFVQKDAEYSEQYYRELFIMDTFLAQTKGEYGENNYDFMADESDAFLNENIMLYQYLNRISKITFDQEKSNILRIVREKIAARSNTLRKDQFGNTIYIDEYFERITKIYNVNPYYDLGMIYTYNSDGKRLTPLQLYKTLEKLEENSEIYNYYLILLFNSHYSKEDLPQILKELKKEIDSTTGNYLLLIKIYWYYVKQFLSNQTIQSSNQEFLQFEQVMEKSKKKQLNLIVN